MMQAILKYRRYDLMDYITLSNGVKMPQLGYGVYQVTKDECERCVSDALQIGYRLIDTAQSYFNEEEVGSAIGISNFYADRMVDFAAFNRIKPMINQVEIHPHNQQVESKIWHDKYGVQLEAWAPFGEGRGDMFTLPELKAIAEKHGKTVAQVILRWHLQRGIIVIPKSTHKERMEENFRVFDFTLSDEDMAAIAALDKNQSSFFAHTDPNMVEWFVKMVEERKKQHDCTKDQKNW